MDKEMIRSLSLVASLVVAGCGSPTPAPSMTANPPKPEPKVALLPTPEPQNAGQAAKGGNYNPNRIFQLKDLDKVDLKVGKQVASLFVMDSTSRRQEGMMFLTDKEVKASEGMIFVFGDEKPRSFWMKNTILPLDLAYIDKTGRIVKVATLKPYDETPVPSLKPAQYVLEMKKGAFKTFGITDGMKLSLPPGLKSKDDDE